jgi:hypothetical protein
VHVVRDECTYFNNNTATIYYYYIPYYISLVIINYYIIAHWDGVVTLNPKLDLTTYVRSLISVIGTYIQYLNQVWDVASC